MPYIGNTIRAADDYRLIDDISSGFNGSATSFALQVAGSAPVPFPKSPQQVLISVNGVIQEPDPTGASGFNLVGTNIVFSSAPTNGHAFFGIIYATADYLNAGGNFPAGSLGAPSLTFIGDENTGIYRKGSGSIGFVADATEIANTDSNGLTISSGDLILGDNRKAKFGASDDLQIFHDGSNSFINEVGTGGLFIRAQNTFNVQKAGTSEFMIKATSDGAVELYHDDSKKFETTSSGVTVTGNIAVTGTVDGADIAALSSTVSGKLSNVVDDTTPQLGGNLDCNNKVVTLNDSTGSDNNRFKIGNAGDLQIYHNGKHSFIEESGTGALKVLSSNIQLLNAAGNETMIQGTQNGAVELYHNNTKTFETTSEGATFDTGSSSCVVRLTSNTDAVTVLQGFNSDFTIKAPSGGAVILQANANEDAVKCVSNGSVELYNDNVKRFSTNSSGAQVHGNSGNIFTASCATNSTASVLFSNTEANTSGDMRILVKTAANQGSDPYIKFDAGGNDMIVGTLYAGGANNKLVLGHGSSPSGGVIGLHIDGNGDVTPDSNNARDFGSASLRWANIFVNDLKMSNKGKQNDIDQTWGDYTIQEGYEDLFLINHRTGKKFKFNLTEVG